MCVYIYTHKYICIHIIWWNTVYIWYTIWSNMELSLKKYILGNTWEEIVFSCLIFSQLLATVLLEIIIEKLAFFECSQTLVSLQAPSTFFLNIFWLQLTDTIWREQKKVIFNTWKHFLWVMGTNNHSCIYLKAPTTSSSKFPYNRLREAR